MGKTPEMVERVGQALGALLEDWAHGKVTTADLSRTAIQAMRVPTEAMRYAVWHDQYVTCGGEPHLADALARKKVADPIQREQDLSSFSALIDAALAAPAEGEGP